MAWSAITIALLFLSAAIGFRISSGWSLTDCIFATPDCSTAAATWVLVFATSAAFVAAFDAATKAGQALRISQRTYDLETQLVLGIALCSDVDHAIPRKAIYIEGTSIMDNQPQHANDFEPLNFDFENLGRTALINVRVPLQLDDGSSQLITIGNIGPQSSSHVSVYLHWNIATWPDISWKSPARVRGEELEFEEPERIKVSALVPLEGQAPRRWTVEIVEPSPPVKREPDISALPKGAGSDEGNHER